MIDISTMDHATASGTLRRLEFWDEGDPTERLALAERALETSPKKWRHVWLKRVEMYSNGRWVRVKKGEIASVDGVPVEIIDEINEVFGEEFGTGETP